MTARLRRLGSAILDGLALFLAFAIPIGFVYLMHVWGYLWYS